MDITLIRFASYILIDIWSFLPLIAPGNYNQTKRNGDSISRNIAVFPLLHSPKDSALFVNCMQLTLNQMGSCPFFSPFDVKKTYQNALLPIRNSII